MRPKCILILPIIVILFFSCSKQEVAESDSNQVKQVEESPTNSLEEKAERPEPVQEKPTLPIVANIEYDANDRPVKLTLHNQAGKPIARKLVEFTGYNPMIPTKENTINLANGESILVTSYDEFGESKSTKWLCLDAKGNLLLGKSGKPVIVDSFSANQRMEYENLYKGSFLIGKKVKIYPCSNCATQTGSRNCYYVW